MSMSLFVENTNSFTSLLKINISNVQTCAIISIYFSYIITVLACFIEYKENYELVYNKKDLTLSAYFITILTIFSFLILSDNFISLYIGVEAYSIIMYIVLSLYNTKKNVFSARKIELTLKYLLISFIGSIIFLTGIVFCFMSFGDLTFSNYHFVFDSPSNEKHPYFFNSSKKFSLGMVIVGLCVKAGLAPYHSWINGIYDSFSSKIFHFSIVYPKFVFFFIIFNIFINYPTNISFFSVKFENFFIFLGLTNLFIGTFSASRQTNVKKLLMYSSIANSGYIFMSFSSDSIYGFSTINYLYMYFFSINFFFIVFFNLYNKNEYSNDQTWTFSNFSNITDSFSKFALTIAIINFSGMPPFIMFFAKLPILFNFASSGKFIFAVIILVFSVISAYYSIKLIFHIWFFNASKNIYDVNKQYKKRIKFYYLEKLGKNTDCATITSVITNFNGEVVNIYKHIINDINFKFNSTVYLDNWFLRYKRSIIKFCIFVSFLGVFILYFNFLFYFVLA